ncbi:hypothetical protein GF406_01770 [candidate division KSB1 bacterium]|nr:hypothetical protein [candidate division KSB1 bacterium]
MAQFRMRLHDQEDRDLIAWLDAQEDKTAAVKAAIRAAMDGGPGDTGAVELDAASLAAIRAVFEAVIVEHGGIAAAPVEAAGCDPELETKLDTMF